MGEINWTSSQLDAITVKAPKVLVSAAAGSGKSTVLTERIIRSLTDKKAPSDISGILAVTFTKAAAEELKAKISKALTNAVSLDPENRHLSAQLIKLPSANISTIHGLCFSLIKSNFQTLGLNAAMRVADESETVAMRAEILEDIAYSEQASIEPLIPFVQPLMLLALHNMFMYVAAIVGAVLLLKARKKHSLDTGILPPPQEHKISNIFLNAGVAAALAAFTFVFISSLLL